MIRPHTIVPVKPLALGKSRLGLPDPERMALNAALMENTLAAAAAFSGAENVIVVSAQPELLELASRRGMMALRDPTPGDLNAALEVGIAQAIAQGAAAACILPVDLPYVSGAELEALTGALPAEAEGLLVTDAQALGTNMLYQAPIRLRRFHFGAESAARHRQAAAAIGMTLAVSRDSALSFDIDSPEDYRRWREAGSRLASLPGHAPAF